MPKTREATPIVPAQSTNSVMMIRPRWFYPNPETAGDNAFQACPQDTADALTAAARNEFDAAVQILRGVAVNVDLFEDTAKPEKPDAVFPNNWISTHHDGRVALFPMYSALRRRERRQDIVDELQKRYRVSEVIDYTRFEEEACYLEGTGGLVLDRVNKIAYVSLSNRSSEKLVRQFADDFEYQTITFTSVGPDGRPVYHTNVMMSLGTNFALVGLSLIPDESKRKEVRTALEASSKEIVELSSDQIGNFAGNAIELRGRDGEKLLVISERGLAAFTTEQQATLIRHVQFVPLKLPTIELAGGSARCMIAEIHLPRR